MLENQELIEQLVLKEIAGVISEEDQARLEKMVADDPAVKDIRDQLHAEYNPEYVRALEEELETRLAFSVIQAEIKKRRWNRNINRFLIVVTTAILVWTIKQYFFSSEEKGTVNNLSLKSLACVTMVLPGGMSINLEDSVQTAAVKEVQLYYEKGVLRWDGGRHIRQARVLVPCGKKLAIQLHDGTSILMNSGSKIVLPLQFYGSVREVSIEGEAFLKVAADENVPFIVHLPHLTGKVLGTTFNVNTYDSTKVNVMLLSGEIQLLSSNDSVTLTPGMAVDFRERERMKPEKLDSGLLTWREGYYYSGGKTIKELIPLLERVYKKEIRVDVPAAGETGIWDTLYVDKPLKPFLEDRAVGERKGDRVKVTEEGDSVLRIGMKCFY